MDVARLEQYINSTGNVILDKPRGEAMMEAQGCAITLSGSEEDRVHDVRDWGICATPVAGYAEGWRWGVRSLYTMLRFYAERFGRIYRQLGSMRNLLQQMRLEDIADQDYKTLTFLANFLLVELTPFDLPVSAVMAQKLRKDCEGRCSASTLLSDLDQLFSVFESELKAVIFIQIPKSRQGYYEFVGSQLDEHVVLTLPAIISDLEEGAKCFAVGRHTACVFHLMGVMEMSVQRLGRRLKIALAQEKNWQNILDQVNKAIKAMNTKTMRQKTRQSEYGAIAAHLFNVKIAWRNSVMHPKASYTEEEAEEVLRAVLVFINHLARTLQTSR